MLVHLLLLASASWAQFGAQMIETEEDIASTVTVSSPLTGSGTVNDPVKVDASSATLQGNTFNAANKLVQLDGSGNLGIGSASPSAKLDVNGTIIVGSTMTYKGVNTTGSGTALLGTNSPASTNTAPYTWFQMKSSDGSTVYIPAWK